MDSGSENKTLDSGGNCSGGLAKRHILAILGCLGFFCVYSLRVNLSVALVAMVREPLQDGDEQTDVACPELIPVMTNDTSSVRSPSTTKGEFDWNSNLQGIVLGSFYCGYVITQIPGGVLAEKYGAKWIFGMGILFTSTLSLLAPTMARWSVWALILSRACEGLAQGVTYPAMHSMIGKWIPQKERSYLSTIIYSGAYLGTVVAYAVSGFLSDSTFFGGWPSAFYVFGAFGCLWFVAWTAFAYDSPEHHPRISDEELLLIGLGRGDVLKQVRYLSKYMDGQCLFEALFLLIC